LQFCHCHTFVWENILHQEVESKSGVFRSSIKYSLYTRDELEPHLSSKVL
jgi:hypothetical protein